MAIFSIVGRTGEDDPEVNAETVQEKTGEFDLKLIKLAIPLWKIQISVLKRK